MPMNITFNVSLEEAQLIRMGLYYGLAHAKESAKAMKHDPLEVYRNEEAAKTYKKIAKKITKEMDAEIKKILDSKKAGAVS